MEKMIEIIEFFPGQCREGLRIGKKFNAPKKKFSNIVVQGMGGSGITGLILRDALKEELKIPIFINSAYSIPAFIDKKTLFIAVSYSGNTEETINAAKEALKKKATVIGVSSGGKLKQLLKKNCISIPSGFPPRESTGFLVVPLLVLFSKLKLIKPKEREVNEFIELIKKNKKEISDKAWNLAERINGRIPAIYATEAFQSVSFKWMTQFNENAKNFAHSSFFPEMNHNELNAKDGFEYAYIVFLRKEKETPEIEKRLKVTGEILRQYTDVIEVNAKGNSLLAQIFYLIYFGSLTSCHLAIIRNIDPLPVPVIDYLKKRLKE